MANQYYRKDRYGERRIKSSEFDQKLRKEIVGETDGSIAIAETAFFNAGTDGKAQSMIALRSYAILVAKDLALGQLLKDAADDQTIKLSLTLINDDDTSGHNGNTLIERTVKAVGGKGIGEEILYVCLPDYHINKISGTLTISATLAGQTDGESFWLYLVQS